MRTARAICETIHLGVLGVWAGAVIMTGVTAALAFPTMKALNPTLPGFPEYTGEHWMIAAGMLMNKVFMVSDWIGIVCGVIAAATLLYILFGVRVRFVRPATVLRSIALVAAIGVSIHAVGLLRPQMQAELTAFWDAAKQGDTAKAELHQKKFDEMHPVASLLLVAQLVMVLWTLGAGGYAALMEDDPRLAPAPRPEPVPAPDAPKGSE